MYNTSGLYFYYKYLGEHSWDVVILLKCTAEYLGEWSQDVVILLQVPGQAVSGYGNLLVCTSVSTWLSDLSGSISGPPSLPVYAVLLAHVSEWKRL